MKELTLKDLQMVNGGKRINVGKCVFGTAAGVASGIASLGKGGWPGIATGAIVGGGMAALKSCR